MRIWLAMMMQGASPEAAVPLPTDTPAPFPVVIVERPAVVIIVAPPPIRLALAPPPPIPPKLPEQVRAVIEAAIDSGDPAAVAAVVKFAKATNPETTQQIDAINTAYLGKLAQKQAREARERREALLAAGPFDYWKGQVEAGASRSTGSTDNLGLYAGAKLAREGLRWRHKLDVRGDLQKSFGITTTERILASYQPNYKVDDRLYAFGIAQYEHDPLLGYDSRFTGGGGIGYRVIARTTMRLDFEGGPALRHTDYVLEPAVTTIAGRGSLAFNWQLSPRLTFTQDSALYIEAGNTNAVATTALETQLLGALKARFSYHVQYERDAPDGRDPIDTLSRATLLYSF